jgi:hypothetical protein
MVAGVANGMIGPWEFEEIPPHDTLFLRVHKNDVRDSLKRLLIDWSSQTRTVQMSGSSYWRRRLLV